jgi:transposase
MRGTDQQTSQMFSYLSPEQMVPRDHPLRVIRPLANAALDRLSPAFSKLYSAIGRPSIPPEQLLRALLVQLFFTVRSERQLMEQLTYNMMFRWFVGLSMDAPVWDVTVFTKNRDRLLEGDVAAAFLQALLAEPQVQPLLSDDHFSVDGTLIEAYASMKSFRPKDGSGEPPAEGRNGERDFHGEKRSNDTHASTTDPDARLYKKAEGQASKLCHMGEAGLKVPPSAAWWNGQMRARGDGEPQWAGGGCQHHVGHRDGRARGGDSDDGRTERRSSHHAGGRQGL